MIHGFFNIEQHSNVYFQKLEIKGFEQRFLFHQVATNKNIYYFKHVFLYMSPSEKSMILGLSNIRKFEHVCSKYKPYFPSVSTQI